MGKRYFASKESFETIRGNRRVREAISEARTKALRTGKPVFAELPNGQPIKIWFDTIEK